MPKFYAIIAGKINKIPELYMIFAGKIPKFYMTVARKMFFVNFFWGGDVLPSTLRLLCL